MITCPNCSGSNPDYRRACEYCGTFLERPPMSPEQEQLRDQYLSMSLGAEDLSTIGFALGIDWHELEDEKDEADRVEMLVRMLADRGRVDEVAHFLRDFRFPQSYAPLPGPYADNPWLTYVFACQNVTSMAQLQEMCDHAGLGEAERLPGEALRVAQRNDKVTLVHEWLGGLKPQQRLQRPRQRRRRR